MGNERDSEEVKLPPSPLSVAMRWVGIVAVLGGLVGYGVWIGTIQQSIDDIRGDVADNEKASKSNKSDLETAETRERDRFDQLLKALQQEFSAEKDQMWELKNAVRLVQLEMRWRHGERMPPSTELESSEPPVSHRPTKSDVKNIAKRADRALERATNPQSADPLHKLSF